jgi:hypothetical protein
MVHEFYAVDIINIMVAASRLSWGQDKSMNVMLCDGVGTEEETSNSEFFILLYRH